MSPHLGVPHHHPDTLVSQLQEQIKQLLQHAGPEPRFTIVYGGVSHHQQLFQFSLQRASLLVIAVADAAFMGDELCRENAIGLPPPLPGMLRPQHLPILRNLGPF